VTESPSRYVGGRSFGLIRGIGLREDHHGQTRHEIDRATDGRILFNGKDVTDPGQGRRADLQAPGPMIFQDPYASMNPRFKKRDRAGGAPGDPPHPGIPCGAEEMVARSLTEVKLTPPEDFMAGSPICSPEGSATRVATARTLILNPAMLVADEPCP
jgi:peptide/nickel transport system ATP-binding protein